MAPPVDITHDILFSAEQLVERLGIARSTFDKLTRQGRTLTMPNGETILQPDPPLPGGSTPFPPPCTYVLGMPRWTARAVNAWIAENGEKKSKRGAASINSTLRTNPLGLGSGG